MRNIAVKIHIPPDGGEARCVGEATQHGEEWRVQFLLQSYDGAVDFSFDFDEFIRFADKIRDEVMV